MPLHIVTLSRLSIQILRLVVIGELVFGDVDVMQAMDDEIQIIQGAGFTKATDTYDGVPEATVTVDELMTFLENCNQGAEFLLSIYLPWEMRDTSMSSTVHRHSKMEGRLTSGLIIMILN